MLQGKTMQPVQSISSRICFEGGWGQVIIIVIIIIFSHLFELRNFDISIFKMIKN